MDESALNLKPIRELEDEYQRQRQSQSPEEFLKRLRSRPFNQRLLQSLSFPPRRKYELFRQGFVTYAYCYKTYDEKSDAPFKGYILFSPEIRVAEEPVILSKVFENLLAYKNTFDSGAQKTKLSDRRLLAAAFSDEEEARYLPLPDSLTEGRIVYVSTLFFEPAIYMPQTPGRFFFPILFNIRLTKYVMPYPRWLLSA